MNQTFRMLIQFFDRLMVLIAFLAVLTILCWTCVPRFLKLIKSLSLQVRNSLIYYMRKLIISSRCCLAALCLFTFINHNDHIYIFFANIYDQSLFFSFTDQTNCISCIAPSRCLGLYIFCLIQVVIMSCIFITYVS